MKQTVTYTVVISNGLADSLLRLRTEVARLSTRALMISRAKPDEDIPPFSLEEVLELARVFEKHLGEANQFWDNLDYIKKLQG